MCRLYLKGGSVTRCMMVKYTPVLGVYRLSRLSIEPSRMSWSILSVKYRVESEIVPS